MLQLLLYLLHKLQSSRRICINAAEGSAVAPVRKLPMSFITIPKGRLRTDAEKDKVAVLP